MENKKIKVDESPELDTAPAEKKPSSKKKRNNGGKEYEYAYCLGG